MRIGEFVEAVESYGVTVPDQFRAGGKDRENMRERIGLTTGPTGFPGHRDYTNQHVRRFAAWLLLSVIGGSGSHLHSHQLGQRNQAMRLLAAAPSGYVVMADGRAWWSLTEPAATLRTRCAVAIPVPEWTH